MQLRQSPLELLVWQKIETAVHPFPLGKKPGLQVVHLPMLMLSGIAQLGIEGTDGAGWFVLFVGGVGGVGGVVGAGGVVVGA